MKLEELAKAFLEGATEGLLCYNGNEHGQPLDSMLIDGDIDAIAGIHAILERLREPSEEMIMAGIIERHDQPCPEAWKLATANIFRAMLSAIDEKEVG